MKIVAIQELIFKGIWFLLMVLVGYGSNDNNGEGVGECGVDGLPFWSQFFSSETITCNVSIFWVWVISYQW